MAIEWGPYEGSGNAMRVGIDVSWGDPGTNADSVTATVEYYTQNNYSWSDDQSLNLGGAIGGSISYSNNQGDGVITKRGTRTYTYNYGNSEYGSSPGSRTFSATVNGAYNGITPSKSVTSKIPSRPITDPNPPTNVSVSRVSDSTQKITWTNKDSAQRPWNTVRVQIDAAANDVWNGDVGVLGGSATSLSANDTTADGKYKFRVRAENGSGNSSYVETGVIYTTPAAPSNLVRTNGTGAQQVVTWSDNASFEHQTELQVSRNGGTTWTVLANLAAGVTTYTDTAALASQKTGYRALAKTTGGVQGQLFSAYSNTSTFTPGTTTPPLTPTNLTPKGITADPTLPITLAWSFAPGQAGDTQTNATVKHRIAGTSTWTTASVTTAQQYTIPANTYLEQVTVEWTVSTKGTDPTWSPEATPVTFTTAVAPIAPDAVKLPVVVDLTTGQLEGSSTAYEVRDMVQRIQSNVMGGGVRAVDASYNITWSQRFIASSLGRSEATFPGGQHDIANPFAWTVTTKSLTSNRATLTFTSALGSPPGARMRVGDQITVSGVGAPFDSAFNVPWVVREVTTNTVTYDVVAPNVTSVAAVGTVSCTIKGHGGWFNTAPTTTGAINLWPWVGLYYELPLAWGGGTTPRKNGVVRATAWSATTTTVTYSVIAPHYFTIGDRVLVEGMSVTANNGERTITGMTANSITVTQTNAAAVGNTALPIGPIIRPTGKDTFFGNFHMVSYTGDFVVPSNWILVAMRNGDGATVEWGTGDTVDPGFDSDSPVFKQAVFTSPTDANANAGNKPPLRIGSTTGTHMRIDGNEIQTMGGDSSTGSILINQGGGAITLGVSGGGGVTNRMDLTQQGSLDYTGAPTGSFTANLNWNSSNGRLRANTSSRRFKENIRDMLDMGYTTEQILQLKPRVFQRNDDRDPETDEILPVTEDSPWYVGFIAEEAEELGLKNWVTYDADGKPFGFAYDYWVVALHTVLLEVRDELAAERERNDRLEERLARLESAMEERES